MARRYINTWDDVRLAAEGKIPWPGWSGAELGQYLAELGSFIAEQALAQHENAHTEGS